MKVKLSIGFITLLVLCVGRIISAHFFRKMSNYERPNIFITGATSFLGRNTCSYLIKKGYNVFAFARENSENNYKLDSIKGLHIIPINIDSITNEELDSFDNIDNKYRIIIKSLNSIRSKDNMFIHYAWKGTSRVDRCNKEIQEYNIEQSTKWLKIAHIMGVKKFIFAGSQAEYSPNYYGIYKNKFAENAKEYISQYDMTFIHMRIFSIFGNNDRNTTILSALLSSIKEKQDFDMTSCKKKWNFLYINDYVRILEKIIIKVDDGNAIENKIFTMDIASDDTRTLREFIKEAHSTLNSKIKLNFGVKEDNSDIFAIPDISNLLAYIGKYKYMKFADAVQDMYKKM